MDPLDPSLTFEAACAASGGTIAWVQDAGSFWVPLTIEQGSALGGGVALLFTVAFLGRVLRKTIQHRSV